MNPKINDDYWMSIVDQVAKASTCRVEIGTVLVHNKRIVSIGYLGSVPGDHHCDVEGCLLMDNFNIKGSGNTGKSCYRTVHSETNSVLKCEVRGSLENGFIECYSTYSPCLECFKLLLAIGVRKIVYRKPYRDLYRDELYRSLESDLKTQIILKQIEN